MDEELIYMIASCDTSIKIYNFGNNQLLKIFNTEYETYLSSLQIILKNNDITNNILNCYLITKGVNSNEEISSNNDIHLRKLNLNLKKIQDSTLETLHTFQHDDYYCNSWMAKCKYFNGYLFAPTCYGKLFIWNVHTKQLCAILNDHSEHAYIRNTLVINQFDNMNNTNNNCNGFYLFTSGDDSITNIYETTSINNNNLSTQRLDQVYKVYNNNTTLTSSRKK
ncbi:predicted protein [Naegleria gruberi]|uniref:Predicted protein n=1 Tax=Naegleria gruberi TaxID=5762 RepID=D2W6V3_NAEGR|nr:uncharacterized protein NAEGRDRAFT_77146 [Naegleria gruberi]EFC35199.1 predicted protein [Naegleria gruberi]|eukprot:XP_002667943.1 predicted protein [Naegleria gruberi strain NEG-M]